MTIIWIIYLGAILSFYIGYLEYIHALELAGIILLAISTFLYFISPSIFGPIDSPQLYLLTFGIGLVTSIVFIVLKKKKRNKVTRTVSSTNDSIVKSVQSTNSKRFRYIIMGCAFILCILFFTLPLVQCSQDSSYNASGWEISTGTGKIFSEKGKDGYPLAFLLLIIPVVLLIASFRNNSFAVLRNISVAGLLSEIIFLTYANSLLNSSENKGTFELTRNNWLVLFINIGLCVFTFYCKNKSNEPLPKPIEFKENDLLRRYHFCARICPFCANNVKMDAIVCQFCNKDLSKEDIIIEIPKKEIKKVNN